MGWGAAVEEEGVRAAAEHSIASIISHMCNWEVFNIHWKSSHKLLTSAASRF